MKTLGAYALCYPVVLPLAFFVTFWAGRVCLGHWPRPSLDDPKFVGGWFEVPYFITSVLLVVGLPVFAIAVTGLLYHAYRNQERRANLLITSALSAVFMVTAVFFLHWDPMGVVSWFMD